MDATTLILRLLDLFVAGSLAYDRITELRQQLEQMQAEGRDPTPEEWDAMFAGIETDSERLDEADHRLNPE